MRWGPVDNLLSTKIGIRGGREIARGLFCASVVAVVVGAVLVIGHVSIVVVVVGALLILAGVAVFVRYSNKRVKRGVCDSLDRRALPEEAT